MQEKDAKMVFDGGGYSKAVIVPTPLGAGFHVHLIKFGKHAESDVIERQRWLAGILNNRRSSKHSPRHRFQTNRNRSQ